VAEVVSAQSVDPIDPDIRRFVTAINTAYAEHAERGRAGMEARREVAELVRQCWRAGGPGMAETRDLEMKGLRLRLYRPSDTEPLPAMLYVHGGGWTLFSIDTHDRLMREYAARAGIAVIGIDYSLSPENKFPVALEEVATALEWIARHATALGIDPERLLVGGDSAGANISVAACLLRRDRGLPVLAGMVLNYGAFAPEPTETYSKYDGPDFSLEVHEMNQFWDNYVTSAEDFANPLVAPLRANLHGLPPAFLAIAECDILAGCNHAMAQRLAAAGVPVEAITYAGATHSFLEAMSIAPLASRALDDQAAWIKRRIHK
jgi:acetyl esterase